MNIVIVESPAKAKTINRYLGDQYTVMASYGHVRDLPSKDGSVRPEEDFAMTWQVDRKATKRLNEIAAAVRKADKLYLATDPDREGEAISWHVLEVLARKKVLNGVTVKRVAFNEITKSAVLRAMAEPRDIDKELVDAYLARRALDYLVGFTLSPLLWRKLPGARSAGRVQSVALRLICERENQIETFTPEEYWSIEADVTGDAGEEFIARLVSLDGQKLKKMSIGGKTEAEKAAGAIRAGALHVASVQKKPTRRNPAPPFTTSTLQQEASRKLGFSASHTMRVAQGLYEGKSINGETVGLITYMRTDGITMAGEAINAARKMIGDHYGERYVPEKPRRYSSKSRNAQEAHEAIRPTDVFRRPRDVAGALNADEKKLYDLIWKRAVASQMASAVIEQTRADIEGRGVGLRATGSVIQFEGFIKLYREGRDDGREQGTGKDKDNRLPPIKEGEKLDLIRVRPEQHFTEPPPRYSEASLVKKLEELGIGRPSTYASILSTLRDRDYVSMQRKQFVPEDKGRIVVAFLEAFFQRYVEYDFTADLEDQLDQISAGTLDWKEALRSFWKEFHAKAEDVRNVRMSEVLESLNDYLGPHLFPKTGEGDPRACPECDGGRLSVKMGKFGAFIGCSNYPDCRYTKPLDGNEQDENRTAGGKEDLGTDPETGKNITLRTGRFGPYLQLGEADNGEKPPRVSLPKDVPPDTLTLELALKLLSLPREVGPHPETGKPVKAGIGRYGPYVNHERTYASLDSTEEVFEVGLNRAVSLLAEKQNRRGGSSEIKQLGEHPDDGQPIRVMKGRYGPYVKHGRTNATLPKGKTPEDVTKEEALELLAAKAKKGGRKKGGRKRKSG